MSTTDCMYFKTFNFSGGVGTGAGGLDVNVKSASSPSPRRTARLMEYLPKNSILSIDAPRTAGVRLSSNVAEDRYRQFSSLSGSSGIAQEWYPAAQYIGQGFNLTVCPYDFPPFSVPRLDKRPSFPIVVR
jgi:hypothetical protein